MEFKSMQELPKRVYDLNGNAEYFSVPVLVYDEDAPCYCEIGYYNFDSKEWAHFGQKSMRLICWCKIPNPTEFVKSNNLISVTHEGYRP